MTNILKIAGNVNTVLNGQINEAVMHLQDLTQLRFALGAGSFSNCSCVGETLVLNHVAYMSYLNEQSQLVTLQGQTGLMSPFLMGLGTECTPVETIHFKNSEKITLNAFYEKTGNDFSAYGVAGSVLFDPLECSYLQKPPIFGENINEHVEKYWAKTEVIPQCVANIFGVVIRDKGHNVLPKELLEKAFYKNPLEKNKTSVISHTHAVLLDAGARHIFTQSIIKEGVFSIFDISDIKAM